MANPIEFVCTGCGQEFENDDELDPCQDEDGPFNGCPNCLTDAGLMDLPPDNKGLAHG